MIADVEPGSIDTRIDAAIDRLIAAYESAGLPPIRAAEDDAGEKLARIEAEIRPLRLPRQLDTFWRRVDPTSITVAPNPEPMSLDFALHSWISHRDDAPGMTPALLFPVCYNSHCFMFVELDGLLASGGACIVWGYGGCPFRVTFPDLSTYLDLVAEMIEQGELSQQQIEGRTYHHFDPDRRWDDRQAARLVAALPLSGFGDRIELEENVREWPERWLASDGVVPRDRGPHGATTTIAELLRDADAGVDASGTIQARVRSLAGSGTGRRVAVDDGTGTLDLWCPTAICTYGPAIESSSEFDVVVQPASSPALDVHDAHRRVLRSAEAHDLAVAQAAAVEIYALAFETIARAQATAVRPMD